MSQQIYLNTLLLVAYHSTVLVYTTQSLVKVLQVRLIKRRSLQPRLCRKGPRTELATVWAL